MKTLSASISDKYSYEFAVSINARSEIYKCFASIVSLSISSLSCRIFYNNPKTVLLQVNDQIPSVSTTMAGKPNMVPPHFLSKVRRTDLHFANKDLNYNNQLNR